MSDDVDTLEFHAVEYDGGGGLRNATTSVAQFLGPDFLRSYGENPDTLDSTPCFFCLTDQSGEVVSWIYTLVDTLTIDGVGHPWIWTGGLFTAETWRGRGAATKLQQLSTSYARERGIGRGSVFSTATTLHIYRKLSYLQPGFVPRYLRVRSLDPLIRSHLTRPLARAGARLIAAPCWAVGDRILSLLDRRSLSGFIRSQCDDLNAAPLGSLLDRVASARRVHFNLTAEKLVWKIKRARRSEAEVDVWLLRRHTSDEPEAYAVVRFWVQKSPLAEKYRDFTMMSLMDFGVVDGSDELYKAIMGHVVLAAAQRGAQIVEVIGAEPAFARFRRRFGLLKVGKGMSYSCCLPPAWETQLASPDDLSVWQVNHFSGDALTQ